MGLSVVNKLEIDDVNYHFARRISDVASTGLQMNLKGRRKSQNVQIVNTSAAA
jgi:hypothetical protein